MKKILLTIVTCIQNEKRIFNQVSNLKSYKLPENLTVVFCFGSNYDDRYAELLKDYKTLKVDTEEQYLFRALKTKKIFESIVNFDYDYIIKKPNIFIIETLLISILPSIGFAYIIFYRTKHITSSNIFELLILSLKFAALHVLLQISGYYRYVFNE